MRTVKATLRARTPKVTLRERTDAVVVKTKFAAMTAIDALKWGLLHNRNVTKGWLQAALIKDKVLDGTKAATHARFWSDYKAQELFMQGMQACMGDDYDPRGSKQKREPNGDFGKNKNGVPRTFSQ